MTHATISDRGAGAPSAYPVLALPPGWQRAAAGDRAIPLRLTLARKPRARDRPLAAAAEVTVIRSDAADAESFIRGHLGSLRRPDIEDTDRFDLGDVEVDYARISHQCDDAEVISEVWWRIEAGYGWAVIGTVARAEYAEWCDLIEDLAATLEIRPAAT